MCNNENQLTTAPRFLTQLVFQARNMTGSNIRNCGACASCSRRKWLCLITPSYHRSAHSSAVAEGSLAGGLASAVCDRQGGVTSAGLALADGALADGALEAGAVAEALAGGKPGGGPSGWRGMAVAPCWHWMRWAPFWRRRCSMIFTVTCLDRCTQGQPLHFIDPSGN